MNISVEILNSIQDKPFIRLVLPLILGILLAEYVQLSIEFILLISLLLILALLILHIRFSYQNGHLFGVVVFIVILLLGFVISHHQNSHYQQNIQKSKLYIGTYEKRLSKKNGYSNLIFSSHEKACQSEFKLLVKIPDSLNSLEIGDRILFYAKLSKIKSLRNPNSFDYAKFMSRKGIVYKTKIEEYQLLDSGNYNLFSYALMIRESLLSIYKQFEFSDEVFGVISALCFGEKSELSAELKEKYSNAGAMHVLAVSGLHVGIVALFLNFLLLPLGKNKYSLLLKLLIMILAMFSFAFITGLSPSVSRASLMYCLILVGSNLKRVANIYNTVFSSMFILLLLNPNNLFDVGFQLSYIAVLGILFFYPYIYKFFYLTNPLLNKIWQLTSVSLAAQLSVLALSLLYFEKFPTYFFLSNLIVIPSAGIILALGFLVLLCSPLTGVSYFLSEVLELIVSMVNNAIGLIDSLAWSSIYIPIDRVEFGMLYLILICLVIAFLFKSTPLLIRSLGLVLFLCVYNWTVELISFQRRSVIVYETYQGVCLHIKYYDTNYLFHSPNLNIDYLIENEKITNPIVTSFSENFYSNECVKIGSEIFLDKLSILYLDETLVNKNLSENKYDIAILNTKVSSFNPKLKKNIIFGKIILINNLCNNTLGIFNHKEIYSVYKKGFFKQNF